MVSKTCTFLKYVAFGSILIGIICLIIGIYVFSTANALEKIQLQLVDKKYDPIDCLGNINMCENQNTKCIIGCNTTNYKLSFWFEKYYESTGARIKLIACGKYDTYPRCNCCVNYNDMYICNEIIYNDDSAC